MTASEKLKALDDLTTYPQGVIARSSESAIRGRRLLDVLPQIVAVVEAADTLPDFFTTDDGRVHSFVPLLDALDEALT